MDRKQVRLANEENGMEVDRERSGSWMIAGDFNVKVAEVLPWVQRAGSDVLAVS